MGQNPGKYEVNNFVTLGYIYFLLQYARTIFYTIIRNEIVRNHFCLPYDAFND